MQLKDAEDKLKIAEEKLKVIGNTMKKEFQIQTQEAVDALVAETRTREDELVKRHQLWVAAGNQTSALAGIGDEELAGLNQALEDALYKLEMAKEDLAGGEQDIANLEIDRDHWKAQAEAATAMMRKRKERNRDKK